MSRLKISDISYTIPSACAEALRAGTADIGIIPAAAYATVPDLVIIPDVAIASRRAVRSILLVSKVPVNQLSKHVRTVALDNSSMTSVALTKILFAKWLGGERDYKPMAPDLDSMLSACDAALLIGDPALQVDRTRYFTLDLAEEWAARLGLTVEIVRVYLTHNIHYYLDPPCLEGLKLYYRLAAEIGVLPRAPELQFV